jgi:hypothetical protein
MERNAAIAAVLSAIVAGAVGAIASLFSIWVVVSPKGPSSVQVVYGSVPPPIPANARPQREPDKQRDDRQITVEIIKPPPPPTADAR